MADRRRPCRSNTTSCWRATAAIYVADNIQDRLWEIDPATNQVTVHKIPHRAGRRARRD
jgi:DNA-binding beta-propeller fold protein YncE